jgi:CubicO group peptidase (beta-lactamase class C family)
MNIRITLLAVILFIGGCITQNQTSVHQAPDILKLESLDDIRHELSKELSREFNDGTFQGSIMIQSKGRMLLSESYGWADKKQSIENSFDAISDIGSIAKTFTAAAILQLVASKELTLNTTLQSIFRTVPEDKKSITIEQLLSHTSGMDNFHNDSDFDVMSKEQALDKILSMSLIASPGQKIAYSNAAYTLLAAIIEEISHQSFQAYIKANLLAPLSLGKTGFYGDERLAKMSLAKGYGGIDNGHTTFEKQLTWALIGAGGMVASTSDMWKWKEALYQGRILPKGSKNLAFLTVNKKWKLGNIRYFDSWGAQIFYIGGSTDYGYTAAILHLPDYDVDIIVVLNAYGDKYEQSTHQMLNKNHILPILLQGSHLLN